MGNSNSNAHLIILGASARAAAQSACRANLKPWCIDLFADLDLQLIAPVTRCPRGQYPRAMVKMIDQAPPGPVLMVGAMENHLDVVAAVAAKRELIGPSAQAMQRARDPMLLPSLDAPAGVRFCEVFRDRAPARVRCLRKPVRSAGGHAITFATPEDRPDSAFYLQQFVPGRSMSAIFIADRQATRLFGVTEQIIGDAAFGARPFHYAGSLGPIPLLPGQQESLTLLGHRIAARCEMVGIFGVDFMLDEHGDIHPVEINPRYTAGIEVIEQATGRAILNENAGEAGPSAHRIAGNSGRHAEGPDQSHQRRAVPSGEAPCDEAQTIRTFGITPSDDLDVQWAEGPASRGSRICGKAVIFARHDGIAPRLLDLFAHHEIADVPTPGEKVAANHPICTVFAAGDGREACLAQLRKLAKRVYTLVSATH